MIGEALGFLGSAGMERIDVELRHVVARDDVVIVEDPMYLRILAR